jgi:diguanylate cyclase (GGDEF)-like protein
MDCDEYSREYLESRVQALQDLIEVARAVVSTLDLDSVLQAILSSAQKFSRMPAGSIALYDETHQQLTLHAHNGLTANFVKRERWEVLPGGLTERVLREGEILYVEDTEQTPCFRNPVAVNEGIRSLICVPLVVKESTLGILYLDDFVPRTFDREEMNLIPVMASFAAMAIANAKLHKRTRVMAITDELTGLHNHRYFRQVYRLEFSRAKRYAKPLSLIMLDVDDFKKLNDTYGHPAGDRVLEAIGEIILSTVRAVDYGFRYGGEELVVILPETPRESALHVAERLRERIERNAAGALKGIADRAVTVSVGVVSYPDDGTAREELFDRVDGLMYRAKRSGKNRVYHEGMDLSPADGV